MRSQMPTVAKWIDGLRVAFGRQEVDQWIRDGLRDGTFGASENGYAVGSHAQQRRAA